MNKRIVIICTLLALLLLGGIGFGFYRLFFSGSEEDIVADTRSDVLAGVPSDAIWFYEFRSFEELTGVELDDNNNLLKLISLFDGDVKDKGAVLSLHYPAKNTVSLLLVVSIENQDERERLKGVLDDRCSGVINKKYSGVTIGKSVIPNVSYAFYNNYFIASASHVLVESSIRHLESKISVQDNANFGKAGKHVKGKGTMNINHQNIGKMFSGMVNYDHLGLAGFVSSFSDWSAYNVTCDGGVMNMDGVMVNTKGVGNFSNLFKSGKSKSSRIYDLLPHNTEYVVTLPVESVEEYLDSYTKYLEAVKKINDYQYLNAIAAKNSESKISPERWFESLGVMEMAVAAVPDGESGEKVVLLKLKDPARMTLQKGYLHTLLGDFFRPSSEDGFSVVDNWVIVGRKSFVEKLAEQTRNELYFSLKMYMEQTPMADFIKSEGDVMGVVNLGMWCDTLGSFFKPQYSKRINDEIAKHNFNFLTFSFKDEADQVRPHITLYSEDMAILPQPPVADVAAASEAVYDQTRLEVPQGPFQIKNFTNGKKNYLQQLEDGKLRLLDENKKGVWTVQFDQDLCGYVAQVDHYKNNKLQMLFCAGSGLYMLDRLGRWVTSYPVDLKKEVALGPVVYDFKGDKNYTVMVLHSDNTIGQYNIKGEALQSWIPVVLAEKIKSMPEMLEMEGGRFWIVRTGYQTIICNENGTPVTDFTRKKRLISDTKVEKKSSYEVVVTNVEGKDMVLNLQTGVMKKL